MKKMSKVFVVGLRTAFGAATCSVLMNNVGLAQNTSAGETQSEEVLVTGSRIVSNGNAQPTPVTVVSAEQLDAISPKGIADALIQLPSFSGSNSRSAGGAAANAGHTYLNLRGLGVARNLVLLDGRRFVATSDGGAADVNLFPQLLLKRTEVVTGGASAAYGSDAVAGVTNFILDSEFTGVKAMVSGGTSTYRDNDTLRASVAAGGKFLDDRLHVLASVDYTDSEGVAGYVIGGPTRKWQRDGRFLINNPRATPPSMQNPGLIVGSDVRFPYASNGGVISGGPLRGIQFLPGGVTAPFDYGRNTTAGYTEGGDGATSAGGAHLETPLDSKVAFTRLAFDFTDDITGFVEGLFARTRVEQKAGPSYGYNATAYQIYADNAYLPADLRARMNTLGLSSFPLGRWNLDFGIYRKTVVTETQRGVLGLNGRFGDGWTWDAYYTHGENEVEFAGEGGMIVANLYNAVDAVVNPATGQVVCRTSLANPGNGCVPINLFGYGSPSAAALDYIRGVPRATQTVQQDVVAFNVRGQPFSSWAGPIRVAVGAEHRREGLEQDVDALSTITASSQGIRGYPASLIGTQGAYFLGNSNPVDGSYDVNEIYGEAGVPLASDAVWARSFDLNGAARITDYSNIGRVNTWKLGVSYEPVADLRLRATKSRDIRAPNVGELYLSQAQTIATVLDTLNGNTPATATIILPGNPGLKEETADTITFGVVYQPGWLDGFSASVDVFRIEIADAIGRLSNQQTIDQCAEGNAGLCSLITRTNTGAISILRTPNLNLASMEEEGLDVELNYGTNLDAWSDALSGQLTLRALATYVSKLESTTRGSPTIDRAGSTPLQMTLQANYSLGNFSVLAQGRMIGARDIDTTYTVTRIARNTIDRVWYADLNLAYRHDWGSLDYELFATANNLFDKDPPTGILTGSTQGTPTLSSSYDVVGRYYTVGVRLRY